MQLVKTNLENNSIKSQINGEQELREDRAQEEEVAFSLVAQDYSSQINSTDEIKKNFKK
jgi:hypothetical protein